MPLTPDELKQYLSDNFGVDAAAIDGQTPLFSSGLLDSFSLVDMVAHIERVGQFKMKATEVNLDNLDSVDRIMAFLASRAA